MGRAVIIQYRILTIRNIQIISEHDQNFHIYQHVLNHILGITLENSNFRLTSTTCTHEINK